MVEINKEMSELLDKQVDTQNENLKIKIPGFTQALACKVCDENESRRKIQLPCKKILLEGGLYKAVSEDWLG